MSTGLLLFLSLIGHVFAEEPPDVNCFVLQLKYVHCSWSEPRIPQVNYTFHGWFENDKTISECPSYLTENGTRTGCRQPYWDKMKRLQPFYTKLEHGDKRANKTHDVKAKVKLNPPTNVTVEMGSDSNLWFYWNQTASNCVDSEIRYRANNKEWDSSLVSTGWQSYCINLPSPNTLYELQVRSKFGSNCGASLIWSDWSAPVVWGSHNDTEQTSGSISVWTPVFYVLGSLILILLVIMLLHHERVRIIIMPVVPKPSLISYDVQDWLQLSKGLKENFNSNFNELACPVREYCHASQSDSESCGSTSSITTDQTDCSTLIAVDASHLSIPSSCSSEEMEPGSV